MSNTTKTSIELAEDLVWDYCKGLSFVPVDFFHHIKKMYYEEIKVAYQDGKDFAIINQCAEESTSAASAKTEAFGIGYDQGYKRALDLVEWKIKNELKTTK